MKRDFKKRILPLFIQVEVWKKLFWKVNDLLRKRYLPIVSRETILKDAIITMSEGRLGSVIIVDKDEKVVGLLSDGI